MRSKRLLLIVCALFLVFGGQPPAASAAPTYRTETSRLLHTGVTWHQVRADGPQLYMDVAHVEPGAPMKIVPVLSNDLMYEEPPARRTETTSSMCKRADGVVCINADFPLCFSCGETFGAFVLDGVVQRSPNQFHEQVSVLADGSLSTDKLTIAIELVGIFDAEPTLLDPGEGREVSVRVDEINRPNTDGTVLYSRAWAARTQTPEGTVETQLNGAMAAIGSPSTITIGATGGPNAPIPSGGLILAATGSAKPAMAASLEELRTADRVELRVSANLPAVMSVGGHPVILRDGERVAQNMADGKIANRHPRSLIGWNDVGDTWVVAVDGRRTGHSVGMTIAEAADFLEHLGATQAVNLDGGGSTTFVTKRACADGWSPCVRNLPSDGRERSVSSALAFVAIGGAAPTAAAPAPVTTTQPPSPPPPPPPPPDPAPVVDEASIVTTPEPVQVAVPVTTPPTSAPPLPPTTAPPTTVTTSPPPTLPKPTPHTPIDSRTALSPIVLVVADALGDVEVAPSRSRTGAAALAATLAAGVALGNARALSLRRRGQVPGLGSQGRRAART